MIELKLINIYIVESDVSMNAKKQEQSEERKNRLLEIYKLHAQLASDSINRLAATNRFYPTVMSGILIIYFAFLQRKGAFFPDESKNELIVGISTIVIGYLGCLFSLIWFVSINSYLKRITRKHEILEDLEYEFEFQFFRKELEHLGKKLKKVSYEQLSKFELYLPAAFTVIFILLIYGGFMQIMPVSEVLKMMLFQHLYPFLRAAGIQLEII